MGVALVHVWRAAADAAGAGRASGGGGVSTIGGVRILLLLGWSALAAVTVWALTGLGLLALPRTILADLGHPWRAQLYLDLELQLLVFAGWTMWRERSLAVGLICAAATMLLGALFTLPYLLAAIIRAKGDVRRVLLGARF
jgi:hypothetical protein